MGAIWRKGEDARWIVKAPPFEASQDGLRSHGLLRGSRRCGDVGGFPADRLLVPIREGLTGCTVPLAFASPKKVSAKLLSNGDYAADYARWFWAIWLCPAHCATVELDDELCADLEQLVGIEAHSGI